jgi:hypothetical protein
MSVSSHQAHPFTGIDLHACVVKQYLIGESFGYGFYIQHFFLLFTLCSTAIKCQLYAKFKEGNIIIDTVIYKHKILFDLISPKF